MPRSGTLVCCLQNLDFSGANQVVLNIVAGRVHESNVVVLSPAIGSFAAKFVDAGSAVRIGDIDSLLLEIGDVFCIICNTIMTCHTVVEMSRRKTPVMWILHEWWDDAMIAESFALRNIKHLTLETVKTALREAAMVIFVCDSQRQLYKPTAESSVIFIGVPDPFGENRQASGDDTPKNGRSRSNTLTTASAALSKGGSLELTRDRSNTSDSKPFTFLCLGIVCPRKNQCWTVEVFQEWKKQGEPKNARLVIVGARYARAYEVDYLNELKALIGDDTSIELYDVTTNVDEYFQQADCLIITSLNEVTPMVIGEAFSHGLPVISTDIAGIKEMYTDGVEGYLLSPGDKKKAIFGLEQVYADVDLRRSMQKAARERFETFFDVEIMVNHYRQLINKVAPPVILIDMDGTLVDWDKGFIDAWNKRSSLDRSNYCMELCVPPEFKKQAEDLMNGEDFFFNLPPMEGSLKAVREMEEEGLNVFLCTSPLKLSMYCAQDKINWVNKHLGESWLNKIIICQDKTEIRGDLLIDDKPAWNNLNSIWKHVVFDAPYNKNLVDTPRLKIWADWRSVILPLLGEARKDEYANSSQDGDLSADADGMVFFYHSKKLWSNFKRKVAAASEGFFRSNNNSGNDLERLATEAAASDVDKQI
jgi:5'-nucleotidase